MAENTQLVRVEKTVDLIRRMTPGLAKALPRHINADRTSRIVLTAVRANPKLADCTEASFCGAILQAASLGLEVNTAVGHAYLVPYGTTCNLIIGYKGFVELAYRSGMLACIDAHPVFDGDKFEFNFGTDPRIEHRPAATRDAAAKLTHAYCTGRLKGGGMFMEVLSRDDIEARRKRSPSARSGSSPWSTDYAAMARKTAVRACAWKLPMSAEMARAQALDSVEQGLASQADAFDPMITAALAEQGLEVPATIDTVATEPTKPSALA
jgi:recombination protein RecT